MYEELSAASEDERALVAEVLRTDRFLDRRRECGLYLPPLFSREELAWQLGRLLDAS